MSYNLKMTSRIGYVINGFFRGKTAYFRRCGLCKNGGVYSIVERRRGGEQAAALWVYEERFRIGYYTNAGKKIPPAGTDPRS